MESNENLTKMYQIGGLLFELCQIISNLNRMSYMFDDGRINFIENIYFLIFQNSSLPESHGICHCFICLNDTARFRGVSTTISVTY